jgi:hypothetical protein
MGFILSLATFGRSSCYGFKRRRFVSHLFWIVPRMRVGLGTKAGPTRAWSSVICWRSSPLRARSDPTHKQELRTIEQPFMQSSWKKPYIYTDWLVTVDRILHDDATRQGTELEVSADISFSVGRCVTSCPGKRETDEVARVGTGRRLRQLFRPAQLLWLLTPKEMASVGSPSPPWWQPASATCMPSLSLA